MKRPIYLDHHATTPLDSRVLQAMMPYLTDEFGNASSVEHRYGWVAEEAVRRARERVAAHIGATNASEVIWTSGATESNNLAIWGVAHAYRRKGNHLVTLNTEHKAVLDPFEAWRRQGGKVTVVPVEADGLVDLQRLADAVTPETLLISVMYANNEIGVVQPIAQIGRLAQERGCLFHCDATQAVGKLPVNVVDDHIHLMSLSAHKLYGPKGVGALYVRRRGPRVSLQPSLFGGGHERGMRSGTLNVPGIVGLAEAVGLACEEQEAEAARLGAMRDHLFAGLKELFPTMLLNGCRERRLPGNLNVAFPELKVERLVKEIYGEIAVSTGAACTSANPQPSHVLAALESRPGERSASSIRFGLGRGNTSEEIERVLERFRNANALKSYLR